MASASDEAPSPSPTPRPQVKAMLRQTRQSARVRVDLLKLIAYVLIGLGVACELSGLVLGGFELRSRVRAVRDYVAEATPVGKTASLWSSTKVGAPAVRADRTDQERIENLEAQLASVPDLIAKFIADSDKRTSQTIENRVGDAERALSARVGGLREFVLGTTNDGGRGIAAWCLLLAGAMLGAAGDLLALYLSP